MHVSFYQSQHREMWQSNSTITVRPKILFAASRRKVDDLFAEVYGEKRPGVERWKEFTAQHMKLGTTERRALEKELSAEDLATLTALPLLRRAASLPQGSASVELYDATRRLLPGYPKNLDAASVFAEYSAKQILREYTGLLNDGIRQARLSVTVRDTEPSVVILCPDLRTAAFTYAAFGGLGVCEGCGRLFAVNPQRENHRFHSPSCAQRVYQREFRKRQKKSKAKKRRK